jgi:hypothetical protein
MLGVHNRIQLTVKSVTDFAKRKNRKNRAPFYVS